MKHTLVPHNLSHLNCCATLEVTQARRCSVREQQAHDILLARHNSVMKGSIVVLALHVWVCSSREKVTHKRNVITNDGNLQRSITCAAARIHFDRRAVVKLREATNLIEELA